MSKIRLVTVGTGYFSQFQYSAWKRIPEVELVAVCNRSDEGAKKIADEYDIESTYNDFGEMLKQEKPDLVDIITPPVTHLEYIREVIQHNRANNSTAIICQKPFCTSLEEAQEATKITKDAGVLLVIHENFRFQPWYAEIATHLDHKKLGDLYQATFRLRPGDGQGPNAYMERQPYFQQMPKFLIHETAIHWVDTFRYLFGEVHSVYAQLRKLNPVIAGEDSGVLIFEFTSGMQAIFDGNRLVDHSADNCRLTMGEMTLEGSEGTMQLNGKGELSLRQHGSCEVTQQPYNWQNVGFGGDCVYRLQRHVIDHLTGTPEIHNTAESYIRNLIIERAIYESAETGAKIIIGY